MITLGEILLILVAGIIFGWVFSWFLKRYRKDESEQEEPPSEK